jgi:serine/threonine-protein kinase
MPTATSPPPNADRNLLFGILALQMDFISRDSLIAATQTWVFEKTKPLGQILAEQGVLTAERLSLLDALVAEHLKAHRNDPQQSLAVLSSVSSVRQQLRSIPDDDLQASLVVAGSATGSDTLATGAYVPKSEGGLRYRILRPHAKGGLGEVFVAEDCELHREVALKEIQSEHAQDSHSRSRFLLEAEITGGLEHPGVVPVYGLGRYDDGRPFYAMRFVKGDSLKEAIKRFHDADVAGRDASERRLALRQLIGRFIDVCNAVAYAHSRGVLHRDLKPGNVMLGKYGETLVVDWGLAKPVGRPESAGAIAEATLRPSSGSGVALTQMGSAIGTPAFMSPEQAAGRLDQMSAASDVYSLGATLYCLLTGRAPVESKDVGAVLAAVQKGEFPPPRQIKRDVSPALEAVCLKAMALQPEARYPSPRALADDLEHWLADEPVTAYREPWVARLARWGRRHRPLVTGAAALLLTAVAALTVSLVVVNREKDRAERARASEALARQRTRQALDEMSSQVIENWLARQRSKLEPAQEEFLKKALASYQEFAAEAGDKRRGPQRRGQGPPPDRQHPL